MIYLIFTSCVAGFSSLFLLFIISTVLVVCFRVISFFIKNATISISTPKPKQSKEKKETKSIVIDPDKINRIYVKKD